jgi:hypothetical protein
LFAVYALQDGGIQAFEGEPATVQKHPVARMEAAGRNPGWATRIQLRKRFRTTTAHPGFQPGYHNRPQKSPEATPHNAV